MFVTFKLYDRQSCHAKVTLRTAYVGAIKKPFQLGKAIHKNHEKRMSVIFFYVSLRHNN